VDHHSGAFVGIDSSKLRHAVPVAEEGRGADIALEERGALCEGHVRPKEDKVAACLVRSWLWR
jgi:hypothetical protein